MQASASTVWSSVQHSIRSMVSPELYKLWFHNIHPKDFTHDCLTLEVENDFCEVWLEKNYLDLIREKAILASGRQIKVRLVVGHSQQPSVTEDSMRSVTPKAEPELTERATPGGAR